MNHVIELFGLPGAGKTTLGRHLAAASAASGRPMAWRSNHDVRARRRLAAAARHAAATPASARRTAVAIARSGQGSLSKVGRRIVGWHATQAAILAAPNDRILLLDEGVLQCLWSIGLVGDLDPMLTLLAGAPWARPDHLVVLDVDPDEVVRRLDARRSTHSRIDRVDEHTRADLLERGHHLMQRLLAWYRDQAPGTIVATTTTRDPVTPATANRLLSDLGHPATPASPTSR